MVVFKKVSCIYLVSWSMKRLPGEGVVPNLVSSVWLSTSLQLLKLVIITVSNFSCRTCSAAGKTHDHIINVIWMQRGAQLWGFYKPKLHETLILVQKVVKKLVRDEFSDLKYYNLQRKIMHCTPAQTNNDIIFLQVLLMVMVFTLLKMLLTPQVFQGRAVMVKVLCI